MTVVASLASGFRPVESSSASCTSPLPGFRAGQSVLVIVRLRRLLRRSPYQHSDMFRPW